MDSEALVKIKVEESPPSNEGCNARLKDILKKICTAIIACCIITIFLIKMEYVRQFITSTIGFPTDVKYDIYIMIGIITLLFGTIMYYTFKIKVVNTPSAEKAKF